jgi:hypothetical protein
MKAEAWNRKLWGIVVTTPTSRPMLIGDAWHSVRASYYTGEPYRLLLFLSRQQAFDWCRDKRPKCDSTWRFKAVRVIERVEVV